MNSQNLKDSKIVKSIVNLLFLAFISINVVLAQPPGEASKSSPSLSETEIQINALANRRKALGKIASDLFTAAGKMTDGSWEQGKLIADAKREYLIGLAELNAVERMNIAFTAEQKAKIADHRKDYTLIVKIYEGMIVRSSYKEDSSRMPNQANLSLSDKYGIYLKPLDPLRAEITTLGEEIKKNTATSARYKEIYTIIEQNSLNILAVDADVLKSLECESDSADKNNLKKYLEESVVVMKNNVEVAAREKYREAAAGGTPAVIAGGPTVNNTPQPGSANTAVSQTDPIPTYSQTEAIATYMEGFKKFQIEKGRRFVSEGIADKKRAFATGSSDQLSIGAFYKHFVLYVVTDDPTYDTFFYMNGQFLNTPVQMSGYYVTAPKITKLSDTYNLYAVTMGFNNAKRNVSLEFRGDKPGKVRYLLVQLP